MSRWIVIAGLIGLGCTPSGGGGRGDCREADNACSGDFICAQVAAGEFECRPPCNAGACPPGDRCDGFSGACVPGDAPGDDAGGFDGGATDRGPGGSDGALDFGLSSDEGPAPDLGLPRDRGFDPDGGFEPDRGFEPDFDPPPDLGPDADLPPVELADGDWLMTIFIAACNPQSVVLRVPFEGGRPLRVQAVRMWCGDGPCGFGDAGAWAPLDATSNDIDFTAGAAGFDFDLFGGLGLPPEADGLYGEGGVLDVLRFTAEAADEDLFCGWGRVRLAIRDRVPYDVDGLPVSLEYVGEWSPELVGQTRLFDCFER